MSVSLATHDLYLLDDMLYVLYADPGLSAFGSVMSANTSCGSKCFDSGEVGKNLQHLTPAYSTAHASPCYSYHLHNLLLLPEHLFSPLLV